MMSSAVSAVIRLDAFRRNLQAIRQRVPAGTRLCPAVKANGYGHGVHLLLPVLRDLGIEALAVAQLGEAFELRQLGWERRILCLGCPVIGQGESDSREQARAVIASGFESTISSHHELKLLGEAAGSLNHTARVQIKIDTGMGRLGVLSEEAAEFVRSALTQPHVRVAGVYTHFATADEPDVGFAREQLGILMGLRKTLEAAGFRIDSFHAANSAAIFSVPGCGLDMVRPGLAIYGYWGGHPDGRPTELQPILRLVSRIVSLRRQPSGSSIGYGRTFRTSRESSIGLVPIGYADGYRRALSNAGTMTLEARRGSPRQLVSVVGRVSMDLVSVDLTGVPDVRVGDAITVLDDSPEVPNSVESVARQLGTIPYEITCAIGPRVQRIAQAESILTREQGEEV